MRRSSTATRKSRGTAAPKRRLRPTPAVTTRALADRRWVHRNQLEIGMYVNELDRPWSDTRFMFQGFRIDSLATLLAVQESCEYALVETEKVARISSNSTYRLVGDHGAAR